MDSEQEVVTQVMTVEQAGKLLQISRGLAYKMATSGALPTIRCGRVLRVPRVQLQRMLEETGRKEEVAG